MRVDSADEAKNVDSAIREWVIKNSCTPNFHVSLERAFLKYGAESPQLFYCWLDLVTNLAILELDYFDLSAHWNDSIKHDTKDVYADFTIEERLDFHRAVTTFVIRYRSLWDKFFGILILLSDPDRYDDYISAKSKRKFFVKFVEKNWSNDATATIQELDGYLVQFENLFRTPELHGSGKARKWTFMLNSLEFTEENPMTFLFRMYSRIFNEVNSIAKQLGIDYDIPETDPNKKTMKVVAPSKKKKMEPMEVPTDLIASLQDEIATRSRSD
jgi:hypothetical protein